MKKVREVDYISSRGVVEMFQLRTHFLSAYPSEVPGVYDDKQLENWDRKTKWKGKETAAVARRFMSVQRLYLRYAAMHKPEPRCVQYVSI